jgi:hypothetical protein
MYHKHKFELQEILIERILLFYIFINFLIPKITLIGLSGFNQGIRIENIVCFFMLLTLLVGKRVTLIKKDYSSLIPYVFFFIIIIISSYTGWLNNFEIRVIFVIRILEYLVFCFLLFKSQVSIKSIEKLVKWFYIMSILGILLQYYNIMGTFESTGIAETHRKKYTAFTSGAWELSYMISLAFFIILSLNNKNIKKLTIYFILTILILGFAGNRGLSIAFILTIFVYFVVKSKKINIKIIIYSFFIFLPILSIFVLNETQLQSLDEYVEKNNFKNPNDLLYNLFNSDYNYIYQILKDFLLYGYVMDIADTPHQYTSLQYRIISWNAARENFLINHYTIIFGPGAEAIYYDSTIFRIFFTLGIAGTVFFIFIAKKIPFYLLVFFLVAGITVDFIASYKLAITAIILHYVNFKILRK